jgi:RNA polymerase sigma-70 factor (ECF subfamily)
VREFFYKAEDINRPGLDIAQPIVRANQREDELTWLDNAIAALPSNLKEPLLLSLTEDMSHRDIAEALGITAKAVEVRIYRAKRTLAGTLGTR